MGIMLRYFLLIVTIISLVPATSPLPSLPSISPLLTQDGAKDQGRLQFAATLDVDADPATNPLASVPVGIARIGAPGSAEAAIYTIVTLAAELLPDQPEQNPAGTTVTFRLQNPVTQLELVREARSDAWGAAYVEIMLDDLHLAGEFTYRVSAPGYAAPAARTFVVDQQQIASDVQLGAAQLAVYQAEDGRVVADLTSSVPMADDPLAAQVVVVRVEATPAGPQTTLLPPLIARRIDAHHARAEIYLGPGEYVLTGLADSATIQAQSAPQPLTVGTLVAPPIADIQQVGLLPHEPSNALVHYRTSQGDAALVAWPIDEIPDQPAPPEPPPPSTFAQVQRTGPYSWVTDIYTVTSQTPSEAGASQVVLAGFAYDPIARSYELSIAARHDAPVDDTMNLQVLGPRRHAELPA